MRKEYFPMLATLTDKPFNDKGWIFETKWDGYRLISEIKKGKVTLYSRNGHDVTRKYPSIVAALQKMKHDAVIDGELVALNAKGVSQFELMQSAVTFQPRLIYHVFDVLYSDGKDVRKEGLLERKTILAKILVKSPRVQLSAFKKELGIPLFAKAKKQNLEGIIAKKVDGEYFSGKRTREWLKIKTQMRQEVVIVGFTEPHGARKYFGALVLAVRQGSKWRYVGHVGTGFDEKLLTLLHKKLTALVTKKKPFTQEIHDEEVTTWVRPHLVGEVKFTEWTSAGDMRHPAFVGLRDDKPALQVTRERSRKI